MTTPQPPAPDPGTHCEWCGAEYADDAPRRAAPLTVTPKRPSGDETEPVHPTHCEWCGAEYPTPDD